MKPASLMQVLVAPHVSEKALRVADYHRQIVFEVRPKATKLEIKQAIEFLFNVKVEKVRTTNIKGKRKNFGRIHGKRAHWKKAYVGLQPGYDINFRSD